MSLKNDVLRIMQRNAGRESARGGANVPITVSLMQSALGRSYDEVAMACWSLQKEGLLAFREDKKGNKTYLGNFRLTAKGLHMDPDLHYVKDRVEGRMATVPGDAYNGAATTFGDPVKALAREMAAEHGARTQTTLSPIARNKQSDNVIKPMGGTHRRHMVDPTEPSAHGSVAEGGEVTVRREAPMPVSENVDAHLEATGFGAENPLGALPLIHALMARGDQRRAANEAVEALLKAGLESLAEQALAAIPDDTPLEREVITLIERLGLR